MKISNIFALGFDPDPRHDRDGDRERGWWGRDEDRRWRHWRWDHRCRGWR